MAEGSKSTLPTAVVLVAAVEEEVCFPGNNPFVPFRLPLVL